MNMLFSQRIGISPLTKNVQIDSMDNDLRVGLWNVYNKYLLSMFEQYAEEDLRKSFSYMLWHHFFKWKIDNIPENYSGVKTTLQSWFFNPKTGWYDIYNFVEISANFAKISSKFDLLKFMYYKEINAVLECEFSAYRFINEILSPITNEHEIKEVENAINISSTFTSLSGCNIHLEQALKMLSDKIKPDYRNSIKESISAVESVVKAISGKPKATLGDALTILKPKIGLHGALEGGFKQIYGYTNDSNGIRHSLSNEPNCDFDDAKYMLVSCSAFINYLISKSQKAGIVIS